MAGHDLGDERQRSIDVAFDRNLQFSKMFLSDPVVSGLTASNFIHPSPIQARAIPLGKMGFDLLVQAKSGTGKTLVFAVLIAEAHAPDVIFPQSLTLVPTREIAVQIETVLNGIGRAVPNFNARSFIGGLDVGLDRKKLQNCSAVIGTPGRINHLIKSNVLNTNHIRMLVLDEADSLISGSLQTDVDAIIKALPAGKRRQTIVSSATFYRNTDRALLKYLNEQFIGVTPKKEVPVLHGLRQFVREVPETKDTIKELMAKIAELNSILKRLPFSQCLVFANTQTKAETYCAYLNRAGWPTDVIQGGQEQRARLKTIDRLREFQCRVLTATDVIGRGIDAENVNLVVNVDVPRDHSVYLHRIGRGGRFGTQAIAITLVSSNKELERFRKILYDIGGSDAFVYRLPVESAVLDELWNFEQYEDNDTQECKYSKLYASSLEQAIRDQGADRTLLETIVEVDSKTELERKSADSLAEDSLEKKHPTKNGTDESDGVEADSIEDLNESKASSQGGESEQIVRVISFDGGSNGVTKPNEAVGKPNIDDLFLAAIEQLDAEEESHSVEDPKPDEKATNLSQTNASTSTTTTKEAFSKVDQLFLSAMEKLKLDDLLPASEEAATAKCNGVSASSMPPTAAEIDGGAADPPSVQQSTAADNKNDDDEDKLDALFRAAMEKLANEEKDTPTPEKEIPPPVKRPAAAGKLSNSSSTSDSESDTSSFSSNTTKKVEVGSNFTTPNARVQEIRSAAPVRQVSSSSSSVADNCSEISHQGSSSSSSSPASSSDVINTPEQNCRLLLEVNNDALFAKIMEQKELEAHQQQRQLQFSIDGCSLEVHDDPVSERDINSRKGSVPDVVPSGITLDPSRLQNRPPSGADLLLEGAGVGAVVGGGYDFALNPALVGSPSNHGSVFGRDGDAELDDVEGLAGVEGREEEAVVAQDQRPKRIRFQAQQPPQHQHVADSMELECNSVGMAVGTDEADVASQRDDDDRASQEPLELPSIVIAGGEPGIVGLEEAEIDEDASSYSSEYDSESSNSSFFNDDADEWEAAKAAGAASTNRHGCNSNKSDATEQRRKSHGHHGSRSMRKTKEQESANKRVKNYNNLYYRTYATWTNQYWDQMTVIRDYVRFANYSRRPSAYGN